MTPPRVIQWRAILSRYQYVHTRRLTDSATHRSDVLGRNPLPLVDDVTWPVPEEPAPMLETLDKTLLKAEAIRRHTATDTVLSKIVQLVQG